MKAVVLKKYGDSASAFSYQEIPEPKTGNDQVKIKVEAFGLNFADVMARKGLYQDAPKLPAVLGYEVVGKVIEQGANVSENWVGKRVVGFTRFGGYAEIAITNQLAVVEVDINDDAGKLLALATQYCTAYYAAFMATTVQKGDLVLQHAAAGGVGTALTQLCTLRGAKVVGLTGSDSKKEYLLKNGCTDVINYKTQNYAECIKSTYGKVDVSFNSVAGSTFKKDLRLLNYGGRLVCYGAAERMSGKLGFLSTLGLVLRMGRIMPIKLLMQSQSLIGVNMLRIADNRPDVLKTCMEEVYKLFIAGKIDPQVGSTWPVSEIAAAHDKFEKGNTTGKLVVMF
ncbi:MAG TPA: zinc-binding dehydrogenase [Flavobacteriales bacterium]|nr:zinc-binding dehydrogenase [Flavobacteriales bacterium]